MKRTLLAAALTLFGTAAFAEPALGTWQTPVDEGSFAMVEVKPCGTAVCGTFTRTFKADGTEYQSPNIGKQILRNMAPTGGGNYEGQVWRPADNKLYIGKLSVKGDTMTMKGCVAGGLICKSSTWKRIK